MSNFGNVGARPIPKPTKGSKPGKMDYSGFAFPKPGVKQKKPPTGIKPGKKTKAWDSARADLKKKFSEWGITECELKLEGCWVNNALGFAHVDKRRNLVETELTEVILACTPCHTVVEKMPHEKMRELLERIINSREV